MYRHGDRSPTKTFPADPYQEDAWPQGWGQLSQVCSAVAICVEQENICSIIDLDLAVDENKSVCVRVRRTGVGKAWKVLQKTATCLFSWGWCSTTSWGSCSKSATSQRSTCSMNHTSKTRCVHIAIRTVVAVLFHLQHAEILTCLWFKLATEHILRWRENSTVVGRSWTIGLTDTIEIQILCDFAARAKQMWQKAVRKETTSAVSLTYSMGQEGCLFVCVVCVCACVCEEEDDGRDGKVWEGAWVCSGGVDGRILWWLGFSQQLGFSLRVHADDCSVFSLGLIELVIIINVDWCLGFYDLITAHDLPDKRETSRLRLKKTLSLFIPRSWTCLSRKNQ